MELTSKKVSTKLVRPIFFKCKNRSEKISHTFNPLSKFWEARVSETTLAKKYNYDFVFIDFIIFDNGSGLSDLRRKKLG